MREVRHSRGARHGREPIGNSSLHPLLMRHAGAAAPHEGGPVLYIDTETTGLMGGTGTFAFLIGVGVHDEHGFEVRQLFLPGPEHERSQLRSFAALVEGASAVVTYNGATFDLPLLRNRFALHGLPDPLAQVPHLDLLHLARRFWRETLPDCSLTTVERRILGASRSLNDVPGFEVPARYFEFLRSWDASGLVGVIEHNETDIVALAALRSKFERLVEDPATALAHEAHAMGLWMERLGEVELALARYLEAASARMEAGWHASLLLKRLGRLEEAAKLWRTLGRQGMAAAWVELAKAQEHSWHDFRAALVSVAAAAECQDCEPDELEKRRERLLRRLANGELG
ncbi:MAG TPA: ribonuclease H-like domain-containing protein [Trueperaceae bacterium]